jgi:hypothetical protein
MLRREGSSFCQNCVGCQFFVKPLLRTLMGQEGVLETLSPLLIKMMTGNRIHIEASYMSLERK